MDNKKELTLKQKRFAEYYIQSGNATESAKKAGYSEKGAYKQGFDNLRNTKIRAYIQELTKADDDKRIADGKEIMEYLTSVMRGEQKDAFGLDAPLTERTRAATELAKRIIDTKDNGSDQLKKLDEVLEKIGGVV